MSSIGLNIKKLASSIFRTRFAAIPGLAEVYKPAISRNKDKLLEVLRENADKAASSTLAQKMRIVKSYYTLEMAPPNSAAEMKKLTADLTLAKEFVLSGAYKYMTVKQVWLIFLICLEVGLWFYLGETIGKMHIVGYKV